MHCQCCQCKCAHEKKAKTLPSLSFCLRGQQREREGNVHQLTRFKPTQCSGIWNPRLVLPCKCLETHDDNDARKWCIFVLWMTLCAAQWDYVAMLMMLRWKQKVCVRICKADTICTLCTRMNTKVNHQQTTQTGWQSSPTIVTSQGPAQAVQNVRDAPGKILTEGVKDAIMAEKRVCSKNLVRCGHDDSLRSLQT